MEDLVDRLSKKKTTILKKQEQPRKISLGSLTMGPRTVIPPGAKLVTARGTVKKEKTQSLEKKNKPATEIVKEKNTPTVMQENKNEKDGMPGMNETNQESLQNLKLEKNDETQPTGLVKKSMTTLTVVSEVVSSLNASEKRLVECIESQIANSPDSSVRLMDPHRAHTVIEATKGILVGMKLKLDAAKLLREIELG
jgi:hypothetical protein